MTTNYHSPIEKGDPVDDTTVNAPLAALDAEISAHAASITALDSEISDARGTYSSLAEFLATPITNETIEETGGEGTAGQLAWDENYLYICVATDTWKRITLESFT